LVAFRTISAPISAPRSAAAVSVVKNGLPVPAREDHHLALFEIAQCLRADVGLDDLFDLQCRLNTRHHAHLAHGILQRQRIHDGRQHAHVVGSGAIHARGTGSDASKDVAPPDDHRELDAQDR
jgi:hypothetical protein